ncbi:serine/threonine-protein kinase [Stigmatella sp. ncwal1]|uniref:non-specific serine/threonine protein kinase n=1 Tax=Stigmatella ashevillensis TaxID=2995309 RepID=A0ABT5D4Q7_9BACT|nr:serine/threonine-protein kinase [Stigmatella ashevillena]MDC0708649.1 serine/threonine-protein kinase [Stigmatella ashevillena]
MKPPPFPSLSPSFLPPGSRVGPWRVVGWGGRGANGAVYQALRVGREAAGPVALKLAMAPGDPRFAREGALLSRLRHPNIPALEGRGTWKHSRGTAPYVAMQWVDGVPLYAWAAMRNPSSRQVFQLLAQVARALEVTHALPGVHRDVKGSNVLVRGSDSRAFLTDFSSGHFAGASPLTWQAMPPCTPAYRSPQACRFAALRPSSHAQYTATPADDVFALGVTAYRLVTDEYPPPVEPGLDAKGLWKDGGPGPLPPEVLNPRVESRLNTLILRMLSVRPEARGTAGELAQALEQAAEQSDPKGDQPLFAWENLPSSRWSLMDSAEADLLGHRPRYRSRARVLETQARDAAEQTVANRLNAERLAHSRAATQPDVLSSPSLRWARGLLLSAGVLLLVFGPESGGPVPSEPFQEMPPRSEAQDAGTDAGTVGLADVAAQPAHNAEGTIAAHTAISIDLPKGPLKGQVRPPCAKGQLDLRGGCWAALKAQPPECPLYSYEWNGGCYMPIVATPRPDTSDKP